MCCTKGGCPSLSPLPAALSPLPPPVFCPPTSSSLGRRGCASSSSSSSSSSFPWRGRTAAAPPQRRDRQTTTTPFSPAAAAASSSSFPNRSRAAPASLLRLSPLLRRFPPPLFHPQSFFLPFPRSLFQSLRFAHRKEKDFPIVVLSLLFFIDYDIL